MSDHEEDDGPRDGEEQQDSEDEGNQVEGEDQERPLELADHGPSPRFEVVVSLFEEISNAKLRTGVKQKITDRKKAYVRRTFELYRKHVGLDLFPIIRLIVPDRDRQRPVYGLKEGRLAKVINQVLGLDARVSETAKGLIDWKTPSAVKPGAGDLSEIAYHMVKDRSPIVGNKGKLTVAEVNRQLDLLSVLHEKEKHTVMRYFYQNLSALEFKWLLRIILKDLKISIRERFVLDVFHPDGTNLFNVCSDLRRVCWTLYRDDISLPREDGEVKVFYSFRPMLCKRNEKSLGHIVKNMLKNNPQGFFYIEEKLDGERIQLHMKNGDYRFYSRNDKDYTYLYGKSARDQSGCLVKHIYDCIDGVDEVILDGEMMVYDPVSARFTPFGYLKSAAVDKSDDPMKPRACFKVFDILYCKTSIRDEEQTSFQLLDMPLWKRRQLMMQVVTQKQGYIEFDDCKIGHTVQDINDFMDQILDNNGEGLVVKRPQSGYVLATRDDSWVKVKPDYMDSLGESFDCTCIGAFWGSGKRGGGFGSFIVGVREEKTGEWLSFSKVGSGISASHLSQVQKHFGDKFKDMPRNRSQNPPGLQFRKERPDVYINPADSFVISIKASEILSDPEGMASGLCLRFPRIERVHTGDQTGRSDKDPLDQLTYDELLGKSKEVGKKKRAIISENLDGHKKRTKVAKPKKVHGFVGQEHAQEIAATQAETSIFSGLHFFVANTAKIAAKPELQKLIVQNGGQFYNDRPTKLPRRIIAEKKTEIRAKSLIKQGHHLIKPQWLHDSVEAGRLLPLEDKYFLHRAEDDEFDGPLNAEAETSDEEMAVDGVVDEDETQEDDTEEFAELKNPFRALALSDSEDEDEADSDGVKDSGNALEGTQAADAVWTVSPPSSPMRRDPVGEDDDSDDDGRAVRNQHYIADPGPGMAADDPEAMDIDPDNIFGHLVFYLDSKENATKYSVTEHAHLELLTVTKTRIINMGGRIVEDIRDPNLTHIVFAKKDISRQNELRRLSEGGKRQKRLVTTAWVDKCYEEEDLQPEQFYAPSMPTK